MDYLTKLEKLHQWCVKLEAWILLLVLMHLLTSTVWWVSYFTFDIHPARYGYITAGILFIMGVLAVARYRIQVHIQSLRRG